MVQPWTMVAWALGPRDRATLPPQRRAGGALRQRLAAAGEGSPMPLPGQTTAAGTEQAWRTQQQVVHRGWGKPLASAGELLLLVELGHLAC